MLASYQFGRAIDNASADGGGARPLSYNDFALDRSLALFDFPHSAVVSYQYELPVGRGKKFGSGISSVMNGIIGGWSLSGIYSYTSGLPLNFTANNNTRSFGGSNQRQRPNISDVNLMKLDNPDRFAWFSTEPFSQPDAFTFGNSPRYVGEVRQHSTNNLHLGIHKDFAVTEEVNLQIRAEMFNALNRNQFAAPQTNFSSNTFGVITSSMSSPRNIQLAMRLTF